MQTPASQTLETKFISRPPIVPKNTIKENEGAPQILGISTMKPQNAGYRDETMRSSTVRVTTKDTYASLLQIVALNS